MDFQIPLSPFMLFVGAVTLFYITIVVVLDARRSARQKRLQKAINTFALNAAAKRFSIIVDTTRGIDSDVYEIITHIASLQYHKVQLVLILPSSIKAKNLRELRALQRSYRKQMTISLVKRKQANIRKLLGRYIKGELVMELQSGQQLSPRFFQRVSIEFLDEELDALAVRQAGVLDDTLQSALVVWNRVVHDMALDVVGVARASPLHVFTRQSWKSEATSKTRYSNAASIASPRSYSSTPWHVRASPYFATILLAILSVGAYILLSYSWTIVATLILAGAAITLLLHLTSYPYSFVQQIILMLFLPFWPVVALGATLRAMVIAVFHRVSSLSRS